MTTGNDKCGPSMEEARQRFASAYAAMIFTPGFGVLANQEAGQHAHRLALVTWRLSKATNRVTLLDALEAVAIVVEAARIAGIDTDPAIAACDVAAIEVRASIRAALAAANRG